jgi:hypothetical protein
MATFSEGSTFAYVLIPAENSTPMQELRAACNTCLEDDTLRVAMCAHLGAASTDTFVITLPTAKRDHIAVSLYSDADGVSKELPLNARAMGSVQ